MEELREFIGDNTAIVLTVTLSGVFILAIILLLIKYTQQGGSK